MTFNSKVSVLNSSFETNAIENIHISTFIRRISTDFIVRKFNNVDDMVNERCSRPNKPCYMHESDFAQNI